MIFETFILLLAIGVIGILFSFLYQDKTNYIHIIIGLAASILFIFLGYTALIGIDTNHVVGTEVYVDSNLSTVTQSVQSETYQYEWVAMFLVIFGTIGIIYTAINIYSEVANLINQTENNTPSNESTTIIRGFPDHD